MLADSQHGEGRVGAPDHEEALVAEGQFEPIGEFAVDDGEEDCVLWCSFARDV